MTRRVVAADGLTVSERILAHARKAPVALSALVDLHYVGIQSPRDPKNVMREMCARLRKTGVPVHVIDGVVSIGEKPPAIVMKIDGIRSDEPLSARESEVVRILREYRGSVLSLTDIADEMKTTRRGNTVKEENVRAAIRRIVVKGIAVEKVGRCYRLAKRERQNLF